MSLRFSIRDEVGDDFGICNKCSRSGIARLADGSSWAFCHSFERNITGRVERCTSFTDAKGKPLYELKQIAYVLDLEELAKGKPGFVRADKLSKEMKDVLNDLEAPELNISPD